MVCHSHIQGHRRAAGEAWTTPGVLPAERHKEGEGDGGQTQERKDKFWNEVGRTSEQTQSGKWFIY